MGGTGGVDLGIETRALRVSTQVYTVSPTHLQDLNLDETIALLPQHSFSYAMM